MSDKTNTPGSVGDCCEAGRLTEDERRLYEAIEATDDSQGLAWRVEQTVIAHVTAAEQRGRDAVLADVKALADDLCDFHGGHGDFLTAGRTLRALIAKHRPSATT